MKTTLRILNLPPSQWEQALKSARTSPQSIEADALALAQRAALLAVYVGTRYNTGCGESEHSHAANKANRQLARVRKALGYSMPHSLPVRIN